MTRFVAIGLPAYDTGRMRKILLIVALSAAALLPLRADAFDLEENLKAQHVQYEPAPQLGVAQDGMSLSEAIESVRRKTGGKILSAETRVQGGREVHYIKILTKDGKVKTRRVNGRSR